ncbi:MAG: family 78 glycoside hydrolase catalytic domain [Candidatus Aminicenantes bacterium]|nr:family 78 glycoside hydrolase catalytic domain [Candidatus Aminicenantes bacterium]
MTIPPPRDLTCEYLDDPLGIDSRRPRFTWKLRHPDRGAVPEAYRIIVGSRAEEVDQGRGDLWDSGRVRSDGTTLIAYGGRPLKSRQRCFWKVRWWDREGRTSAFSRAAFFETGLLERSDWSAHWIGMDSPRYFKTKGTVLSGQYRGDYIQTEGIYLAKNFSANPRPRSARAYVCGLGFFEFLLNGRKIGDHVLDPAQTDYGKSALYATFDISEHLLRKNAAVIVLGNGRHIKNFGFGPPKAICQIEIEEENGERRIVATDETWTSGSGPVGRNGLYDGESFDGRKRTIGHTGNAVRVWGPPLRAQMLPPIRVTQTLPPRRISMAAGAPGFARGSTSAAKARPLTPSPNIRIYDFGQNFSGWVRLRVHGPAGTRVTLRHAELRNEDGSLNTAPNQGAAATDVYILNGRGSETFEPRFTYHGFRYAEISGTSIVPDLEAVEGRVVHSDVKPAGRFRCSDALLNRVHRNVLWGQRSNLMSIPTDCPQRDERHGWLGDAHLSAEEAIFNFDLAAFYAKFLKDIRSAQGRDGSLPDFVPPYVAGFRPADPAWGSAYISLAWLLYWYYGDAEILSEHFTSLKKYIDFLSRHAVGQIIRDLGKYGDWCSPGSVVPKQTPLELTSTWFYYHDALLLSRIAAALERADDAAKYADLARSIKDAFNAEFLEGDQYRAIRTSPVDKYVSQTSNVLPLHLHMVPSAKKRIVVRSLLRSVVGDWDRHIDTGIIGTRYLLDVLSDNGYVDLAYRVARQTTYPGWGYMVKEGATTLWERWEKNTGGGMNSHNHIMLGSVDAWFYKTIAGVRCAAPGWTKILVRPPDLPGLSFAKCSHETIRGMVESHWERLEDSFSLKVRIPIGAEAEVRIPLLWKESTLREDGRMIWPERRPDPAAPGWARPARRGAHLVLKVPGGTYRFTLQKRR